MRYNTILENISARPLYIFAFFLSLLVLMHLVLVLWLKLSDEDGSVSITPGSL